MGEADDNQNAQKYIRKERPAAATVNQYANYAVISKPVRNEIIGKGISKSFAEIPLGGDVTARVALQQEH